MQHMIKSVVFPQAFKGDDVARVRHHADNRTVARLVLADGADRFIRKVLADRTALDAAARIEQRLGKGAREFRRLAQHIEGIPLGGFSSDIGKTGELLGQTGKGCDLICHRAQKRPGIPGRFSPPVILPSSALLVSSTCLLASLTAAMMTS